MKKVPEGKDSLSGRTLAAFLALTFGLTWGGSALLVLFYDQITALTGEVGSSNPLIILMIYAPGIAGTLLIQRHFGQAGLKSFLRRLTLWRAGSAWWLFLIVGIPAVVYTGAAIKGSIGDPLPFSSWSPALSALALALFLGPIEEFGWRGLALPLLQRRFAPLWAGLILGVIWAVWHIPALIFNGMPQSSWSIAPFMLGIVAISVILTQLFNTSRGSLLIAVFYHFQMMNPLWPDAQPWDNLLWIAIAVVFVAVNWRKMLDRSSGVTSVLMPEDSPAPAAKGRLEKVARAALVIAAIGAAVVLARLGMAHAEAARPLDVDVALLEEMGSTRSLTILPLYEEAAIGVAYESGHGVSYLVQTDEQTILMDLGNNPEGAETAPLVKNFVQMNTAADMPEVLFISHTHPDHLGGLTWRPESFELEDGRSLLDVEAIYTPEKVAFAGDTARVSVEPEVIGPGVATLGRMPFVQPFPFWLWAPLAYEQALVVHVEGKGLLLISGCGHPTLEKMVARAEALTELPVAGVVGGLHYEAVSEEQLAAHVAFLAGRDPQLVALSPHDDGPEAIEAFQQAFPAAYRHIRVGESLHFGAVVAVDASLK